MRSLVLAALAFFAFAAPAAAQLPSAEILTERREAIARLDFLVGEFEGEGWVVGADRVRQTFTHLERAETRIDGLVLTVEGAGSTPSDPAGHPGFRAFGVISWNDEADKYEMQTFAHGRHYAVDAALVSPGVFQWSFKPSDRMTIRYTIDAPQPGQWRELGHISFDNGASWIQFFEMNLTRKAL